MNGFWVNPANLPLPEQPARIVSLVPSQTELLAELGLEQQVVGITKFCVHPRGWFKNKPRVGGTKTLNLEKIRALQPQLILANKEENSREAVHAAAEIAPVHVSDISTLPEALDMIRTLGLLTGTQVAADNLARKISRAFAELKPPLTPKTAAYLIWKDPWMAAGRNTFIDAMLEYAGFRNVFGDLQRYPELSLDALRSAAPDCVLLSSEPYPFREKHRSDLAGVLPGTEIYLVDGELFSWYGSRLLLSAPYFRRLRLESRQDFG